MQTKDLIMQIQKKFWCTQEKAKMFYEWFKEIVADSLVNDKEFSIYWVMSISVRECKFSPAAGSNIAHSLWNGGVREFGSTFYRAWVKLWHGVSTRLKA